MCDNFFLELVELEVYAFLDKPSRPDILLFPPLLSRHRFSIHQLVESSFPDLETVSVGQADQRRTAVYPRRRVPVKMSQDSSTSSGKSVPPDNSSSAFKKSTSPAKKNAKPSVQPYVPPALRNREGAASPRPQGNPVERSLSSNSKKKGAIKSKKTHPSTGLRDDAQSSEPHLDGGAKCLPSEDTELTKDCSQAGVEISVCLPETMAPADSAQKPEESGPQPDNHSNGTSDIPANLGASLTPRRPGRVIIRADTEELVDLIASPSTSPKTKESLVFAPGILKLPHNADTTKEISPVWRRKSPPVSALIESVPEPVSSRCDEPPSSDSSVSWNRRSKSPPLEKSLDRSVVTTPTTILKSTVKSKKPAVADPALSSQILDELTAAFGEDVSVQHASQSYRSYGPVTFDGSESDSYLHVLEAYDMPSSFSTADLAREIQMLVREFVEIRWVDDTHALCLCPNATVAQQALSMKSPLGKVKLRPLAEASEKTKTKARSCAQMDCLSVAKERPETNATTARRMVASALGMKIVVPKEKRDQEREQLTVAKEKKVQAVERKVQAVKKKEDIWEGRV